MKVSSFFFCLSCALLSCNGCGDDDCFYKYVIPVSITPEDGILKVGDTITIVSKFPRMIRAHKWQSNDIISSVDVGNVKFCPGTGVNTIDSVGYTDYFLHKYFDFIEDPKYNYNWVFFEEGSSLFGEYLFENDSFKLEIKLIAKAPGYFLLYQNSGLNAINNVEGGCPNDLPDHCFESEIWPEVNGGTLNLELFQELADPHWNTWAVEQENKYHAFSKRGAYVFKVVE